MDSLFTLFAGTDKLIVCLLIIVFTFLISLAFTFGVSFKLRATKSFFLTSSLTPVIVAAIISMVAIFLDSTTSGAIRIATIAVALGLVRFRSANGRAEELLLLFAGIGFGLIAGLGYVVFAAIFAAFIAVLFVVLSSLNIFSGKRFSGEKVLNITIPESLEYDEVFNDTFSHYLKKYDLIQVKTTAMGSLFRLSYCIEFKNIKEQKEFIDEIRTRNGNLEVSIVPYTGDNKSL